MRLRALTSARIPDPDLRCSMDYVEVADTKSLLGIRPYKGRTLVALNGIAVADEPSIDMAVSHAQALFYWMDSE